MDVAEIIANFDEELANARRELLENALFLETEQRLEDTQTYQNFVDLSFPPTTSPLIPSPIISNSSECLYGSPQASTDTQGTLKFKSEEENEPISPREHPIGEIRVNEILMQDNYCDFFVLDTNFHFPELEGKYFVLEQAGEGTFSTVYKAISLMKENSVVALKRISPKCSPERILREMQLFRVLGGKGHVPPLMDVMRIRDQVTLVLPFIEHQKFKDFMPMMEINDIRNYMKSLFESLAYIHSWYIIHRDLKPGNFLYDPQTKTCALVDFGLAQVEISKTIRTQSQSTLKRKRNETMVIESSKLPYIPTHRPKPTTFKASGENDIQIEMKTLHASRGGTRGFRAPEVLLKHQNQTVAIDVWSAGVILLSILSTRYPFFSAPDDLSSLAEIASLCGTKELQDIAIILNRKIHFPFEAPKQILKYVCKRLSCRRYEMPEEAFHLLERCLDLNPITRITAQEALNHPFLN